MKAKLCMLLLCVIPLCASTKEKETTIVFSEYSSDLRIKEVSADMAYAKFDGLVKVSGTLIFRLDRLDDSTYGEPLFADFIPDADQIALFPYIVSGSYAWPLKHISVLNVDEAFKYALVDQKKERKSREIRIVGVAVFKDYSTAVECDSRNYYATLVSFVIPPDVAMINSQKISGC